MTEKAVRSRTKSPDGKVPRKKTVTRKKKEKILIIDDEPAFVESCCRTMEAKAYKVFTSSDREHAMEILETEPDVIILGTLTPVGQTFAMYKWLENHPRYKDIPLLVIDKYFYRCYTGYRLHFDIQQLRYYLISVGYLNSQCEYLS